MAVETVSEQSAFQASQPRVDREKGIIHGVRWLGEDSQNGRHYGQKYRTETIKRYSGIRVNKDHPEGKSLTRRFDDWVGTLENLQARPDANYGDIHVRKGHRDFEAIMDAAENHWRNFGLSPVHAVDWKISGKVKEAMGLDEPFSVDIVLEPATNKNLFESRDRNMASPVNRKLKAIFESAPESTKGRKALTELVAEMADLDVSVDPEGSHEDNVKAAFDAGVGSIMASESLDADAKQAKLGKLFGAKPATQQAAAEPTAEAKADKTRLADIEHRLLMADCKNLLLEAKVEATDVRVAALAGIAQEQRKALCESFPKMDAAPPAREGRQRPASSPPANGSGGSRGNEKAGTELLKEHLDRSAKLAADRRKVTHESRR